jgi:hypothetical protein
LKELEQVLVEEKQLLLPLDDVDVGFVLDVDDCFVVDVEGFLLALPELKDSQKTIGYLRRRLSGLLAIRPFLK